jgi:DNA-binding SARP family transcriptional activator
VRVTLLGSVAAEVDGVAVPLGGRRQRAVFAMLALNVGRVVSVDHLARVLWEDDPPDRATMALQSMISRLRRVLGTECGDGEAGVRILTRAPGWVLDLEMEAVDATRFAAGVAEGRRLLSVGEATTAARVLSETLALWPGQAAGELEIADFAREDAVGLEQARLDASELLFTAQLATGETQVVVEEARRFVAENPFRERAWMSLIVALYRGGRQADALAAIAELRTTLADGLGLDPSTEIAVLEQQILTHDSALQEPSGAVMAGSSTGTVLTATTVKAEGPGASDGSVAAPEPGVVGRAEVFGLLDEVIAQAARGRGRVVLVQGVAGIGKSTVLRALDSHAASVAGGVVIHGAGVSESPAFWPWVTAVRELVTTVPALVDPAAASALAKIDPAFFSSTHRAADRPSDGPAGSGDPTLGRTHLYRAAVDLLVSARGVGPLTVVLDDVQALDEETSGLLAVAMPEATAAGVLFVLGLRTEEGQDYKTGVERLLEGVRRDAVVRIRLADLTSMEVGETIAALTDRDPDPAVTEAVWRRSRGNPLFVTELVRLLASEDRLDPDGVYSALPSEVRGVLRRRLDRLPTSTVSLLIVVALIGRATDVALLARVTDRQEDDVVDGCEIAVLAGLLVDGPRMPGSYTLSHDLVRQTLVETVAPARKVRLHARIARALEEAPRPGADHVVEVARHALLAAPAIGAPTALPFLLAAADDAMARLALSRAEQHLQDALTLAAQLPSTDERARIERGTRSRLAMTHVYGKGPPSFAEDALLAAAFSGSPLTLSEDDPTAWFAAMTAAVTMGAYQWMAEEAARALSVGVPPSLEAMVRLELGLAQFELGHLSAARQQLEITRQFIVGTGESGALVLSLAGPAAQVLLGVIAHFEGDEPRADAMLAEAASMSDDAYALVVVRFSTAWLAAYRRDPVAAAAAAKSCVEVAEGSPANVAMGVMLSGWAAAVQGDPAGVRRLDQAFADYTADGTLLHVPMFLVLRAEAHAATGDTAGARALVAQARSVASITSEDCLGPRLTKVAADLERVAAGGAVGGVTQPSR